MGCLNSNPGERRLLTFEKDETFTLLVGNNTRVTINALLCIVCCNAPRTIRFGCGHLHCCEECAIRLTACPICREPITERQTHRTFPKKTDSYLPRTAKQG